MQAWLGGKVVFLVQMLLTFAGRPLQSPLPRYKNNISE